MRHLGGLRLFSDDGGDQTLLPSQFLKACGERDREAAVAALKVSDVAGRNTHPHGELGLGQAQRLSKRCNVHG